MNHNKDANIYEQDQKPEFSPFTVAVILLLVTLIALFKIFNL